MKFVITTTYENVDADWLSWYLERLSSAELLPGSIGCVGAIKKHGYAEFSSKDPTSSVTARTQYEVIKPKEQVE